MHPLDSVRLKVVRAKEHLDFLYGEIGRFWASEPKPCEFIREDDTKESGYVLRFKVNKTLPLEWSLVVGDFAHNLRSALDHLAWQLALLTTDKPKSSTEFPIFNDSSKFKDSHGGAQRKMKDILTSAHSVIESLQPYNRGNWSEVEHLWWLHELDRIDKHREIVPCFTQTMVKFSYLDGVFRSGRLNDGDRIKIMPVNKGQFNIEIGADIAFDIPTVNFPIDFRRLDGIHKFVREEVIPRFSSFFSQL